MARSKRQGTLAETDVRTATKQFYSEEFADLEENENAKRMIKIDPIVSEILMFW